MSVVCMYVYMLFMAYCADMYESACPRVCVYIAWCTHVSLFIVHECASVSVCLCVSACAALRYEASSLGGW